MKTDKDKRKLQVMRNECKKTNEIPKKKKKETTKTKQEADIFQRLIASITNMIHKL